MLRRLPLVILMLFSVSLAACDDDDAAPTLPVTQVEESYYNLFCEKIETCDVFNAFVDLAIMDRQGCLDFLELQMEKEGGGLSLVVDAVNEGTVIYDAEKGYTCVEAMSVLACDEFGDKEPEECIGVFTGTIADGSECTINEECVSGYCKTDDACPGTCEAFIPEGSACDYTDECVTGAKCVLGECTFFTAPVAAGGECDENEDWCAEGLFCHPDTEECTARLSAGEDCENVSDLECDTGTMCIGVGTTAPTCVTITVMEAVDDECGYNAGDMCAMYNDLVCAIDDFQSFTGTCQISSKLDDMCFDSEAMAMNGCDPWGDLYCDIPEGYQDDGFCAAKKAGGQACTDNEQCLSDWCNVDVCEDMEEICQ
ncbi:hypothetical protein KKF84_03785 [Myxococcota bacterium]|nr:hypothetical protein [Myxococcota bacterium]